jgi:cytochrome P450
MWRDPLGLCIETARALGDMAMFRFGPVRWYLVNDAEGARHVLQKNHAGYVKSQSYRSMELVVGRGLLTNEGASWHRQRKLAQPAFHRDVIGGFVEAMARATEAMLARWGERAPDASFDVHAEMMRLALRIVGLTLFGADVDDADAAIGDALGVALEHTTRRAEAVVKLPTWLPTPSNLRFRRALARLDGMVYGILEERRRRGDLGRDLLGMLMAAVDESTPEGMSERQLRDEVMTLVLAGHETTANALAFTVRLLCLHPEIFARLRAEVDAVLGGRAPRGEDLAKLALTERVVLEALRLYPPAWCFERQALADDVVCGYRVRRGGIVGIVPYALHRYEKYWPDPEAFDPDRFLPERSEGRPRYAYLPFAEGPRACIGRGFALTEAKVVLALVAQRFELALADDRPLRLLPGITLRPAGGIHVRARRRT